MSRHRSDQRRPFWQTLRDAGFILVVMILFGLLALILGAAIGLRFFG